jgi:crossover junction endodeoxyribonuclease RusA
MSDHLFLQVNGMPAPQGSKTKNRYGAVYESSKAVKPWREAVRAEIQRAMQDRHPFEGPVEIRINFFLPRPKGHYGTGRNAGTVKARSPRWPTGVPDVDKLARAVLDGITEGGAWKDDGQVVALIATKEYAGAGDKPGCSIQIMEES